MILKPFLFLPCQAWALSPATVFFPWIFFRPGCYYFWGSNKCIYPDHPSNYQYFMMASISTGEGACPGGVRELSGCLQEYCFTGWTWRVIFPSFSLPLRSLSNNPRPLLSPFYFSLEHSWDLCNCRVLFCGNNNLISIIPNQFRLGMIHPKVFHSLVVGVGRGKEFTPPHLLKKNGMWCTQRSWIFFFFFSFLFFFFFKSSSSLWGRSLKSWRECGR